MGNHSSQSEFILLGLSDLTDYQIPVFLLILLIYVATLVGNLLIIFLVISDSHLQTPMYFFLGNLSVLDIFNSSISTSHFSFDIFTGNRLISYPTCITQVFLFTWFASTESAILTAMSYDRYAAICHPLRYMTMINNHLSVQIAFFFWVFRCVCCLVHALCALRLSFPEPTTIPGLFCELYQLIQLSCSNTFLNYLLLYFEAVSIGVTSFLITFLSYAYIFKTILKMKLNDGRRKAYSTCSSHLMVVFIFYGAGLFNYFQLKTKNFLVGRLISVFYTVFTPLLNPIIYSLRNSELMGALQKILSRKGLQAMNRGRIHINFACGSQQGSGGSPFYHFRSNFSLNFWRNSDLKWTKRRTGLLCKFELEPQRRCVNRLHREPVKIFCHC